MQGKRESAEYFAGVIFDLVVKMGGDRSTAHHCAGIWWEAIERGDFGEADKREER